MEIADDTAKDEFCPKCRMPMMRSTSMKPQRGGAVWACAICPVAMETMTPLRLRDPDVYAPIVVAELRRTCQSHPSQWEGRTTDGRYLYIRYRGGVLRIGVGDSPEGAAEHAMFGADEAFVSQLSHDPHDGTLDFVALVRAATCLAWALNRRDPDVCEDANE